MVSVIVVGGGAWGTALGSVLARNADTTILTRNPEIAEQINVRHRNPAYLGDSALPDALRATTTEECLKKADGVVLALPSSAIPDFWQGHQSRIKLSSTVIVASKGLNKNDYSLLSEMIKNPVAMLSGPTFAKELALKMPTRATFAMTSKADAKKPMGWFEAPYFTLEYHPDIVGVELLGVAKNVLAIACGMLHALGAPENQRAALISRYYQEIGGLLPIVGGKPETIYTAAGIGDLFLTCTSTTSRNFSFGADLVRGKALDSQRLVEGKTSARALVNLAAKHSHTLPITGHFADIIDQKKAANSLLTL